MTRLLLRANAKINLYLEITGNRADGYHGLVMVMQSIDLCDRLEIYKSGTEAIRVHCDHPQVPTDATNLAYRAAHLMQQKYPDFGGVEIAIDKQIPIGAGLAGGSADAAAVLVGLDRLWELGLTQPELWELGSQLGSDVPFCISGGTALATGRGEIISPLPGLAGLNFVICKPRNLSISTVWAYQTFRANNLLATSPVRDHSQSSQMLAAIAISHDPENDSSDIRIGRLLYNDLERVVLPAHPAIAALKSSLQAQENLGVLMSGSGSAVFAIAANPSQAQRIADTISTTYNDLDVWLSISQLRGISDDM
jgi:4-diphosphocytidyl-2-C-methyl-D-erythritol kinase